MRTPIILASAFAGSALAAPPYPYASSSAPDNSTAPNNWAVPSNSTGYDDFPAPSNQTCEPLPIGAGPIPYPDDPDAFRNNYEFTHWAVFANIPANYELEFQDLDGAVNNINEYLGNSPLGSYDPSQCAIVCNSLDACAAFNIFFERSPIVNPNSGECANPPSSTEIRCTYWSERVSSDDAHNIGQLRGGFQTAIAGSNGYLKANTPDNIDGFSGPTPLDGAIESGVDFLGSRILPIAEGEEVNSSWCALECEGVSDFLLGHLDQTDFNRQFCWSFDVYVETEGAGVIRQVCAMYGRPFQPSEATNHGQARDYGAIHVERSYGYTLTNAAAIQATDKLFDSLRAIFQEAFDQGEEAVNTQVRKQEVAQASVVSRVKASGKVLEPREIEKDGRTVRVFAQTAVNSTSAPSPADKIEKGRAKAEKVEGKLSDVLDRIAQ